MAVCANRSSLHAQKQPETIVLVVAPTPLMARRALAVRGLDPLMPGIAYRMATRIGLLRGWSPGTPVVADRISEWAGIAGAEGEMLANVLLAQIGRGCLRLLQDSDIEQMKADCA
jgi:hypothetical protein